MFFGIGSIHRAEDAALARELGVTWVSAQPMVVWFALEAEPGVYVWSSVDNDVKMLQEIGLDATMALYPINLFGDQRAQLMNKLKASSSAPDDLSNAFQTFLRDSPESKQWNLYVHAETLPLWINFIKAAVERYDRDGKEDMPGLRYPVRNWHFGQEFPLPGWDSAPEYVEALKQTYAVIKSQDANARVILVGLAANYARLFAFADGFIQDQDAGVVKGAKSSRQAIAANPAFKKEKAEFEYILREGKNYFDVADIHLYEEKETFIEGKLDWFKHKMQEYGYAKPIWSLEGGGPLKDPLGKPTRHGDPYFGEWSAKENAELVVKLHALGAAKGMERYHWGLAGTEDTNYWNGPWTVMGLTTSNRVKKPSYHTFKLMVEKLKGFESAKDKSFGSVRLFEFAVDHRQVYIAWSSDAIPRVYDLSAKLGHAPLVATPIVTQTQPDGRPIVSPPQPIVSTSVPLSQAPVFLEAK